MHLIALAFWSKTSKERCGIDFILFGPVCKKNQIELFQSPETKVIQAVFQCFSFFSICAGVCHNFCRNYRTMPQSYASYSSDPLKQAAQTLCFSVFYVAYGTSESHAEAADAITMQKFCSSTCDMMLNMVSEILAVEVLQNAPAIFCNPFCHHFWFFDIWLFFVSLFATYGRSKVPLTSWYIFFWTFEE